MNRPAFPQTRFDSAMAALNAGRLDEADRKFRALQKDAPGDVRLMHLLGMLALQRSRPEEAVEQFRRAVRAAPEEPGFRGLLGNALRAAGRLAEARAAYLDVLQADPASVPALVNLGNLALEQGKLAEAEAMYRRAEVLQPADADLQIGLGQLALAGVPADGTGREEQRRQALAQAAAHFSTALRLAPGHPAALAGQGHVLAARGRMDEAIAAYGRSLQQAPQQAEVAVSLGKAALRAGRIAESRAALEHALRVLPPWPQDQAQRQYAECYRSFAAAAAGDAGLYAELSDPMRMATVTVLQPGTVDPGLEARLAEEILERTPLVWEPANTTTSAGRQSEDLSQAAGPAIAAFRGLLEQAIARQVAALPHRPGHPFLGHRPQRWRLNLWATVLHEGGHQRPHIHPKGWMSGVYYVQVPPLAADAAPGSGRLELGRPEDSLPMPPGVLLQEVEAVPGRLVFFPSYLFHRTIPFRGADARPRISLAFDLVPEA